MDCARVSPQSINMKLDLHRSIRIMIYSLFYEFFRLMWKRQRMQRFISPCLRPGLKWRRRRGRRGSSSTIREWFQWLKTASRSRRSPAPPNSPRTVAAFLLKDVQSLVKKWNGVAVPPSDCLEVNWLCWIFSYLKWCCDRGGGAPVPCVLTCFMFSSGFARPVELEV